MIPVYFNKPAQVQAIQWLGDNLQSIYGVLLEIGAEHVKEITFDEFQEQVEAAGMAILCFTPNGTIYAQKGDYIVFQSAEDFYPVAESVFVKKYQTKDTGLCFSQALIHLKNGGRVARAGWNGNKRPPVVSPKPTHTPTSRLEVVGGYAFLLGSKGSVAVMDAEDLPLLEGRENFTEGNGGYFQHTDNSTGVTTKLQNLILPTPEGYLVDHINGDILDNRKENLRVATPQQNNMNRRPRNTYKGITWDRSRNKWNASIQLAGKSINLGRFKDPVEAAKAYDQAAWEYFGEFAYLNFPKETFPHRMFIFKVNGSRFITNREPLLSILGEGTEVQYQTHYDMKTADGSIVPWLCSQSDMDAEDWEIV
jgi:hypothetical protein